MSIQIDTTQLTCSFCKEQNLQSPLVRSMHGLYCTNDRCYSRMTGGNLVPPTACRYCKENAFYLEVEGTVESAMYQCIACGKKTSLDE